VLSRCIKRPATHSAGLTWIIAFDNMDECIVSAGRRKSRRIDEPSLRDYDSTEKTKPPLSLSLSLFLSFPSFPPSLFTITDGCDFSARRFKVLQIAPGFRACRLDLR